LNSIVTLNGPAPLETAARALAHIGAAEAGWLAQHAENNRMPGVTELLSTEAVMRYRARAREQRTRAGRIEAAVLLYAYALEREYPDQARSARGASRDFGEIANLIGDEATLGFRTEADHRQLRENLTRWARAIAGFETQALVTPEINSATQKLFHDYFR
jgi:hypothetical protein